MDIGAELRVIEVTEETILDHEVSEVPEREDANTVESPAAPAAMGPSKEITVDPH